MLRLLCPCCGSRLNAEERLIGQTLRCPKCLSPVPVKRPASNDLAKIVEPTYEPVPAEEDSPKPKNCPKCSHRMAVGETLCGKCGWHIKLEAYFDDLTEEALARGREPKTREEKWLEAQLHEVATPQDVMWASALCVVLLCVVAVVFGRIWFGAVGGTLLGLLVAGGLWFGWFMLMRRFGILHDPHREERIARQSQEKPAARGRKPGRITTAADMAASRLSESALRAQPSQKRPLNLPESEYDVDDIDLFDDEPAAKQGPRKKSATPRSPHTTPREENPRQPDAAVKKHTASGNDDDWLNDLL